MCRSNWRYQAKEKLLDLGIYFIIVVITILIVRFLEK